MIKKIFNLMVVLIVFLADIHGASVNVYFAGGQSNATSAWADGIRGEINAVDPDAVIVWTSHGGQPIREWYTTYDRNGVTGRQQYYLTDFYDPSPTATGLLEEAFNNLISNGDSPVLRGLFWFQGETDTFDDMTVFNDGYYNNFLAMRGEIASDLNTLIPHASVAIVWREDNLSVENANRLESIREQQQRLGELGDIYSHDTKPYDRPDSLHIAGNDRNLVGQAMAAGLLSIPEPSSTWLLSLASFFALLRRKR